MDFVAKIWKAMDGKKTFCGASILTLASYMTAIGMIWGLDYPWWGKLIQTLQLIGGGVATVGGVDKARKQMAKDKPPTLSL